MASSLSISKPPGVRMMAKEIQKPPYEDRAVAPKVLPTAISLDGFDQLTALTVFNTADTLPQLLQLPNLLLPNAVQTLKREGLQHSPHPRQQLHQSAIAKRNSHHQVRRRHPARIHIDQAQHKSRQCESTQSQWSWVRDLPILDLLVSTWLEFSTEGGQTLVT